MTLGEMFTREWKCEAPVWPAAKCTPEARSEKLQHTECGWRFEPTFDPEEWGECEGYGLTPPETVEIIRKLLIEKGMTEGFPELIGKGRFVTRDAE